MRKNIPQRAAEAIGREWHCLPVVLGDEALIPESATRSRARLGRAIRVSP